MKKRQELPRMPGAHVMTSKVVTVEANVIRVCNNCKKTIQPGEKSKCWNYFDTAQKRRVSIFTHEKECSN